MIRVTYEYEVKIQLTKTLLHRTNIQNIYLPS